jgi:hypothetical protein
LVDNEIVLHQVFVERSVKLQERNSMHEKYIRLVGNPQGNI